jgi:hypothetical protein
MLALVVTIVSLVMLILSAYYASKLYYRHPCKDMMAVLAFVCGTVFIAMVILWATIPWMSRSILLEMEAFYGDTLSAYNYAIEETRTLHLSMPQPGLVDIAYSEQAKAVSERIKELRERVEWYNGELRGNKFWNTLPILGDMWADTDLPPLHLTLPK